MGALLKEDALWRHGGAVRTKADPRKRNFLFDVVFGHRKIDDLHATAIFDHKVHSRFGIRRSTLFRYFRQGLAGIFAQVRIAETNQQNPVRSASISDSAEKIIRRVEDRFSNPRTNFRVFQPFSPFFISTFLHPERHRRI